MSDNAAEVYDLPPLEPSAGAQTPKSNESLRVPIDIADLTVTASTADNVNTEQMTDLVIYTIESSDSSSHPKTADETVEAVAATAPILPIQTEGDYSVVVTGPNSAIKGRGEGWAHLSTHIGDQALILKDVVARLAAVEMDARGLRKGLHSLEDKSARQGLSIDDLNRRLSSNEVIGQGLSEAYRRTIVASKPLITAAIVKHLCNLFVVQQFKGFEAQGSFDRMMAALRIALVKPKHGTPFAEWRKVNAVSLLSDRRIERTLDELQAAYAGRDKVAHMDSDPMALLSAALELERVYSDSPFGEDPLWNPRVDETPVGVLLEVLGKVKARAAILELADVKPVKYTTKGIELNSLCPISADQLDRLLNKYPETEGNK